MPSSPTSSSVPSHNESENRHQDDSHAAHSQHKHSLSTRIVIVVLLYTLVVAAIVSGLQTYRAYQSALQDVRLHFKEIESSYLPSLAAGMWSVDQARVNALLDGIAKMPDIGRLRLQDEIHQTESRQHPLFVKALFSRSFKIVHTEDDEQFVMGELSVDLMDVEIQKNLIETAKSIAITTTITLMLSSLFILFLLRIWIIRHLKNMADYVQKIDLNHLEYELKLERHNSHTKDELDTVVLAINQMRLSLRDDISQRNKLDQELAKHREQLEQLVNERTADLQKKTTQLEAQSQELLQQNQELDAYAHTVAHDLKQPVSNLIAASDLLNTDKLQLSAEKSQSLLSSIQNSAKKMHAIIDSLLLLSNIRKNETIPSVSFNTKLSAMEACKQLQDFAQQRGAHIELHEFWPNAYGYEQWVEEIWSNFLSNAIKYGGENPKIELGASLSEPGMVKCWVKDYGKGLSEVQQKAIFHHFVRFDVLAAEGHGLGLSIVKRIAAKLGGKTGYERTDDGGSLFWFTLPASE